MNTLLAQMTDTHIREAGHLAYGRLDTATYLSAAVDALLRLPQKPDALILTGDLTDFGQETEYRRLAQVLSRLDMPYYLMPGNHDDRDNLRSTFPDHTYLGAEGFIQYSMTVRDMRIIALDTTEPGQEAGRLCQARIDWLRTELARDTFTPTVIAMHHPPFKTMIAAMDEVGLLEGAGELATIVAARSNVHRILCGHLHRTIFSGFAGTVASTAPSPAHQVVLDLATNAPLAWNLEPPGFHLHVWGGCGPLLTHVVPVGDFDGPYPFP
ncbi:MAG: phosphodiesterase [Betaproteobacteria bacterium]|nr:phosphodiesterase [Betaproteobacteria bacterium]